MIVNQGEAKKLKILIIRFSSMGDIVLTSPVVRCLKEQMNVEIHYLTKRTYLSVIKYNPHIAKMWVYHNNEKELKTDLKAQNFDFIIDLHKSIRSTLWSLSIGGKRLTYDKSTLKKLLYIKLGIKGVEKKHVVERYMEAIEPLGVRYDHKGLDFFFEPKMESDITLPQHFIAAAIGGTHFTKRFPASKWKEVINLTKEPFVLIGGKQDVEMAKEIESDHPGRIINLCGRTSIQQSAMIIKKAYAVISNDTGMMHIAAALNKNIVSIWGGTIPEFGFWPLYPEGIDHDTTIEVNGLDCRPCSKFGRSTCPKKHFKCMLEIESEQIVKSINTK